MSSFDKVEATFGDLEYMKHAQAAIMRDFITEHDAREILELGFYHGKSSAYIAAILEDLGRGHLVTMDRETVRKFEPNIETVLSTLGLSHRVTPVYAPRSYTWELAKMIRSEPRPQFDLCYLDGGHTWEDTGFGFVLVDMLLRPGGWIIFDDLPWTMQAHGKPTKRLRQATEDERTTPAVGLVFDLLVPHLGYTDLKTVHDGWWGIARKPVAGEAPRPRIARPTWRERTSDIRRRLTRAARRALRSAN